MKSTSGVPWRRLVAESVAVVASILAAFAIDAAWDARGDRREAREVLEGLREEFIENRSLADSSAALVVRAYEWLLDFHMFVTRRGRQDSAGPDLHEVVRASRRPHRALEFRDSGDYIVATMVGGS